jgi:hypothetical protein
MIVGAGLQALGSIQQGNAQAAGLEASAKYNERQAKIEADKGVYEAGLKKEEADRVLSKQRTGFAAMGLDFSGSAADVASDTGRSANMDIAAIRYGAKIKSTNYNYQAKVDKLNASTARTAGYIGALSPLINVAGTFMGGSYGG